MSTFDQQVQLKRRRVRRMSMARQARLNYKNRSAAWIILALAVLALLPQASFALEVQGRELSWSMPGPDGWAGGNFYQIETAIQNTDNNMLRDLLREVQDGARDVEAVLIHLEDAVDAAHRDPSFSTRTLTEIVVRYFPYELLWDELRQIYDSGIRENYPQGNVHLSFQSSFMFDQRMAFEAVFQVRLSETASLYRSIIAVPVSFEEWLIFDLKVDSSRHEARLRTLKRSVRLLRFN